MAASSPLLGGPGPGGGSGCAGATNLKGAGPVDEPTRTCRPRARQAPGRVEAARARPSPSRSPTPPPPPIQVPAGRALGDLTASRHKQRASLRVRRLHLELESALPASRRRRAVATTPLPPTIERRAESSPRPHRTAVAGGVSGSAATSLQGPGGWAQSLKPRLPHGAAGRGRGWSAGSVPPLPVRIGPRPGVSVEIRPPASCERMRRCFRQVSRSRTVRADGHVRAKARRRRRMTPRERAPQTRPRRDPSAPDPSRPRLKARGASFGAQGSLDQEPKARQGANSQAEGGGAEDPAIFSDNCGRSAGGAAHRVRVGAVHCRETAFLANARRGAWHRSSALSRHSAPAA